MMRRGDPLVLVAAILTLGAAVCVQIVRDRVYPRERRETQRILYIPSGDVLQRIALEYDALAADVYWIRAIQHYGGDRLATDGRRKYELLYPLLDVTTTLDPYFTIAYRFGAIFLSEGYPGGPGRPDQAIALLRKGIAAQPTKWQYYHDIAFVYYWHLRDFKAAAAWFQRGARQPNAPNWLEPLAATMLTAGGDRMSARFLWQQILQSDQPWLRRSATRRLQQLDALDEIDRLQKLLRASPPSAGEGYSWMHLVRRGILPDVPHDPTGTPYELDPATGAVRVSPQSSLQPMPDEANRFLS